MVKLARWNEDYKCMRRTIIVSVSHNLLDAAITSGNCGDGHQTVCEDELH
jgi:hypothetical protein